MKKVIKPPKKPTKKQNVKPVKPAKIAKIAKPAKIAKLKIAIAKITDQLMKDHPKLIKRGSNNTDLIFNKKLMKGGELTEDQQNKIMIFLKDSAEKVNHLKDEFVDDVIIDVYDNREIHASEDQPALGIDKFYDNFTQGNVYDYKTETLTLYINNINNISNKKIETSANFSLLKIIENFANMEGIDKDTDIDASQHKPKARNVEAMKAFKKGYMQDGDTGVAALKVYVDELKKERGGNKKDDLAMVVKKIDEVTASPNSSPDTKAPNVRRRITVDGLQDDKDDGPELALVVKERKDDDIASPFRRDRSFARGNIDNLRAEGYAEFDGLPQAQWDPAAIRGLAPYKPPDEDRPDEDRPDEDRPDEDRPEENRPEKDRLMEVGNGGAPAKYKSTGQAVFILYKKKKYKRTIYVKDKRKTRYCKINNEYILLSKLKIIA